MAGKKWRKRIYYGIVAYSWVKQARKDGVNKRSVVDLLLALDEVKPFAVDPDVWFALDAQELIEWLGEPRDEAPIDPQP